MAKVIQITNRQPFVVCTTLVTVSSLHSNSFWSLMAHRNHAVVQKYLFLVVENSVALPMANHRKKLDVIEFHRDLKENGDLFFHLYLKQFRRIFFFFFPFFPSLKVKMIERKHRKWEIVESCEALQKSRGLYIIVKNFRDL